MTLEEFEKKLTELEDLHAELKAQIAELKAHNEEKPKPPHPRRTPMIYDAYHFIYGNEAHRTFWSDDAYDVGAYSVGNVFKTEAEAKFAAERLKVLAEMREWAGHNYDGAYLYYHRPSDEILSGWSDNSTYCFGDIRFKCVDDAENCIKAVGKERLKEYYFMILGDEAV